MRNVLADLCARTSAVVSAACSAIVVSAVSAAGGVILPRSLESAARNGGRYKGNGSSGSYR